MLMAVIAVLSVLFSIWALISPARRLIFRSDLRLRKHRLIAWGLVSFVVVIAHKFVLASIDEAFALSSAQHVLAEAVAEVVTVVLVLAGLSLVRFRRWTPERLEAIAPAIMEKVRINEAGTAAAVVARIIDGLGAPDKGNNADFVSDATKSDGGPEDTPVGTTATGADTAADSATQAKTSANGKDTAELGASKEYEELMDVLLRDALFVEALVREQTETIAKMLTTKDDVRKYHSDVLLREAFVGRSGVLVAEITSFPRNHYWHEEFTIPSDCVLLRALVGDPAVARYVGVARVVGEAVVEEIEAGRIEATPSPSGDAKDSTPKAISRLPLPEAGIRIIGLVLAESIRKGTTNVEGTDALVEIVKALAERVKPAASPREADEIEASKRLLKLVCDTFVELAVGPKPDGDGPDKSPSDQDTETQPPELVRECLKAFAKCLALVVQVQVCDEDAKRHWVQQTFKLYNGLATGCVHGYTKHSARAEVLKAALIEEFGGQKKGLRKLADKYDVEPCSKATGNFEVAFGLPNGTPPH